MEQQKHGQSMSESIERKQDKNINKQEPLSSNLTRNNLPTTSFSSTSTQIWASITASQSASLQALHQTMQQQQQQQHATSAAPLQHQEHLEQDRTQAQGQQHQSSQQEQAVLSNSPSGGNINGGNGQGNKPPVGSSEWHRIRRDNHKEVERRRRETINEGINEIARIVPGCEKNKGQILQRAASYIRQLKENEAATLEKWTLEKLLTDQAINELNHQVEVLKAELSKLTQENQHMKRLLEERDESGKHEKRQKK